MLSENLKKARLENKRTQKSVADAVGVSQVAIQYFEAGTKVPSLPVMVALAATLNRSIDELVK